MKKSSLNHTFRAVWFEAVGALKKALTASAAHASSPANRNGRLRVKPLAIAVAYCFSLNVQANPIGAQVVNGMAAVNQAGNTLTVINSPNAIINWQGFSINQNETTSFVQQTAASSVLNRVVGANPSQLLGALTSNGKVFLINPAGILVGQGAQINVAGLVASTLNLSDADFLAGKLNFTSSNSPLPLGEGLGVRGVVNQGAITTPEGGTVYLVAPQVENQGIITTPRGETLLAAGNSVQIIDTATPGVTVQITGAGNTATNLGRILADSGRIGITGALVKNSGTLSASSLVSEGGKIFLKASQDTYVEGNSRVEASGIQGGGIEVLGNRVAVTDNASIDASGQNGGGTVLVGGDYQGKNPDVQNAQITYVSSTASISADGGILPSPASGRGAGGEGIGNGGKVIIWADDTTRAYGSISARGGAQGGNGGFVETSGKQYLDVAGIKVSTTAPNGTTGNWLLDPTDITIVHGTATGGATFTNNIFDNGGGATATLNDFDINANLANNDITITTTSGTTGVLGDIKFDASAGAGGAIVITNGSGSARTLTLTADNDIVFSGGSTTFQTTTTASVLGINFNPGAARKIDVQSGASAIFNGFNTTGFVGAFIGGASGKTWENSGTVTLSGVSHIDLDNNGVTSTFNNIAGGTLNLGSTQGWAIQSTSGAQAEPINNAGTVNVTASTAFEAAYSQSSTGTLNISDGQTLSMQNADVLGGVFNIGTGSTLILSEVHSGARTFSGATINDAGTLSFGTPGTATFSNTTLSHTGDYTIPTGVTYTGNNVYSATVNLTIPTGLNISTSGNIGLAGGAIVVNPSTIVAGGLTLEADSMTLAGAAGSIQADIVTIKPKTIASVSINLGGSDSAGILGLTGTELNTITASVLKIGDSAAAGGISVSSAVSLGAGIGTLELANSGTIHFAEPLSMNGNLLLSGGASVTQAAAGMIIASHVELNGLKNVALDTATNFAGSLGGTITPGAYSTSGSILFKNGSMLSVSGLTNTYAVYNTTPVITLTTDNNDCFANCGLNMAIGTITASGGTVTLNAAGSIIDLNGTGANNVTANALSVTAQNGIGLDTTVSSLSATNTATGSNGIGISNTGNLSVTGISDSSVCAAPFDCGGPAGIKLVNSGTLGINGAVSATGTYSGVHVSATGATAINAAVSGYFVGIATDSLSFGVDGLGSITATQGADIAPLSASKSITIGAASCVTANCLLLSDLSTTRINAPELAIGREVAETRDGVTLPVSGPIDITMGINRGTGKIAFLSGDTITQDTGAAAGIIAGWVGAVTSGSNKAVSLNHASNQISNIVGKTSGGAFSAKSTVSMAVTDYIDTYVEGFNYSVYGISTGGGSVTLDVTGANTDVLGIPSQINAGAGAVTLTSSGRVDGTGTSPDIIGGSVSVTASGPDAAGPYYAIDGAGGLHIQSPSITLNAPAGGINAAYAGATTLNGASALGNITVIPLGTAYLLTIGGNVASSAGSITLAGSSVTQNANVSTAASTGFISVSASSGNIVMASNVTTSSGGAAIYYAAPYGTVTYTSANFPGPTPTITQYVAPPPPPPPPPTVDQCVADPALAGCTAVLPTLDQCTLNPALAGCTAVLPTVATCTATPATPGCTAVLPTLADCTTNPTLAGCTVVLPTLATCTATPTASGCTAVLPTLATCTATPTAPGCTAVLPTVVTCTATPTAPGCTAVLPTVATCTATPTAPGCTAVLPTLATCTATPTAPGCTAVLPTLATCTATPTAPGCTAVLPPATAIINPVQGVVNQATAAVTATTTASSGTAATAPPTAPVAIDTKAVTGAIATGATGGAMFTMVGPAGGTIGGKAGTFGGADAPAPADGQDDAAKKEDGAKKDDSAKKGDAKKKDSKNEKGDKEKGEDQPSEKPEKC